MSAECARGGGVGEVYVPQEASPCVPPPPNKSMDSCSEVYLQDELGSFLFTRICHSNCFGDGGFSFLTLGCSIAMDQLGPKDEEIRHESSCSKQGRLGQFLKVGNFSPRAAAIVGVGGGWSISVHTKSLICDLSQSGSGSASLSWKE